MYKGSIMKNVKKIADLIITAAKLKFTGPCDRIRRTKEGEEFWQNMMRNKRKISERQFLSKVDLKRLLDEGETWEEYKSSTSDNILYYESSNAYFFQTAGFEFIWKK